MKKRCLALSPGAHLQCELKRNHLKRGHQHRVMNLRWSEHEGVSSLIRLTHPEFAEIKFNTDNTSPPTNDSPVTASPEHQLREWWTQTAEDEIALTVPKAVEYGATDLIDIGLMLARTMRRNVTEEEAAELGVFFYLIGKIARWQSAIERGERPSDDTLLDIGVYVRMAQRIRDAGGWPGTIQKADHWSTGFHTFCMPETPCGPHCIATKTHPNRSGG